MKRTLKIFGFSMLSVLFLSVAVLSAHIILVTQDEKANKSYYQLSRIDIQLPLDSTDASEIRSIIQSIEGVNHAYVNIPDGILVYAFDSRVQNSDFVYKTLTTKIELKATPYIPSEPNLASGCPVGTNDDSLLGKLMNVFN